MLVTAEEAWCLIRIHVGALKKEMTVFFTRLTLHFCSSAILLLTAWYQLKKKKNFCSLLQQKITRGTATQRAIQRCFWVKLLVPSKNRIRAIAKVQHY